MELPLFTLVDTTISKAIEQCTIKLGGIVVAVGSVSVLILIAWIVWKGYNILIGAVEGELGPFLQRVTSKYLFLMVAVGIGITSQELISQSIKLQKSLINTIQKEFSGMGEIYKGEEESSPFSLTDKEINRYLNEASIYLTAELANADTDGLKARGEECKNLPISNINQKVDKKTEEKIQRCASLSGFTVKDLGANGDAILANVQKAKDYLKQHKVLAKPSIVLPNNEGGMVAGIVFWFKCLMMAIAKYISAIGEAIIGFFLLLPVLINRIFFSMCLMLAPIFIGFGAWEKTKSWFSAWLNVTLGYAFALPVITLGVGLLFYAKQAVFGTLRESLQMGIAGELGFAITSIPIAYLLGSIISRFSELASQFFGGDSITSSTAEGAAKKGAEGAGVTAKGVKATGKGAWGATKGAWTTGKWAYNKARNLMSASKD